MDIDPQGQGEGEQQRGYTVLVVEDDPNHQLLIRRVLTREGSPFSIVQVAGDAPEAERFSRQMSFDCLLVDNRIPGSRGLDLIGTLRGQGVVAPCVLMTSVGSEDLVVQAYRQQVADYVIKETGFWKELPQILLRVIRAAQARQREVELRQGLERSNEKLDALLTDLRVHNEELSILKGELEARTAELDAVRAELAAAKARVAELEGR
jgi:DNA-binding NtrC family response regulator